MSRASAKARGTAAERAVADWLHANGFPYAERAPKHGSRDQGDITGTPGVCFEIKDEARFDMATAMDEAVTEARHCRTSSLPVVVRRRKGRPDPAEWYALLRLGDVARLLVEAGYGSGRAHTENAE
jgi:hypothetical protein